MPALLMKILAPSRTQPPSTRFARVEMPAASEPAPGSVSPKAAIFSPAASGRSQSSFCCSVPKRASGSEAMVECAFQAAATDWSARPISSITAT